MDIGTVIVIIAGMVFGMSFVALLLDHRQKRTARTKAIDANRIEHLEDKIETLETQVTELSENQEFMQKLLEDKRNS